LSLNPSIKRGKLIGLKADENRRAGLGGPFAFRDIASCRHDLLVISPDRAGRKLPTTAPALTTTVPGERSWLFTPLPWARAGAHLQSFRIIAVSQSRLKSSHTFSVWSCCWRDWTGRTATRI
jgi:hypothetical protein